MKRDKVVDYDDMQKKKRRAMKKTHLRRIKSLGERENKDKQKEKKSSK